MMSTEPFYFFSRSDLLQDGSDYVFQLERAQLPFTCLNLTWGIAK